MYAETPAFLYSSWIHKEFFMKKKILVGQAKRYCLLAVLLTIVGAMVFAQAPTLDKLRFSRTVVDGVAVWNVSEANKQISGAVVIPETHEGITVARIPSNAFQDCIGITSVIIPNTITQMVSSVFRGCTGLTSITIPASVNTIGQSDFNGCTNLTSVTFQKTGITILTSAVVPTFPGDLTDKYRAGGAGVYTRTTGSNTWTRTGDAPAVAVTPPPVNVSLDGVWAHTDNPEVRITASGSTGTFSSIGYTGPLALDAINKGYVKIGEQAWRNIRSTDNLKWSAQTLIITVNDSRPNVAMGTNWANSTFTMSADGKTISVTGVTSGNVGGAYADTYTRVR